METKFKAGDIVIRVKDNVTEPTFHKNSLAKIHATGVHITYTYLTGKAKNITSYLYIDTFKKSFKKATKLDLILYG